MFAWLKSLEQRPHLLLWLGGAGYLLRVILWLLSAGSNDIRTWYYFSLYLSTHGFSQTYVDLSLFNHPPLMGLWSVIALRVSEFTSVWFPIVFKLPSLVAELITGLLVLWAWRARGQWATGCAAFAAYGLSLSCIVISAHHGNTDAIYFCLAFAAAYLLEAKRAPFWSGLALGAALNVKLIPVMIALPLASRCTRPKDLLRYCAGGSLGAIPFLWTFGVFDATAREAFFRNIFLYRSNLEYWGVELVVRWVRRWTKYALPELADGARAFGNWYSAAGGKLLLVASAVLAAWHFIASRKTRATAQRTRLDAYELTALGFALFLLFGSGFGVQYVGCVVAALAAVRVSSSVLVSLTSGAFITTVYYHFVTEWFPIYSDHFPMPPVMSPLSNVAWLSLATVSWMILRGVKGVQPTDGRV